MNNLLLDFAILWRPTTVFPATSLSQAVDFGLFELVRKFRHRKRYRISPCDKRKIIARLSPNQIEAAKNYKLISVTITNEIIILQMCSLPCSRYVRCEKRYKKRSDGKRLGIRKTMLEIAKQNGTCKAMEKMTSIDSDWLCESSTLIIITYGPVKVIRKPIFDTQNDHFVMSGRDIFLRDHSSISE